MTQSPETQTEPALRQGWFDVTRPEPGLVVIAEPLHAENVKSFLITGTERALLIDTGTGVGDLGRLVAELTDLPVTVVVSHAHWDHVGGNRHFADVRAPASAHAALRHGWSDERMARAFAPDQLSGPLPDETDPDHLGIPPLTHVGTVADGETFKTFNLGGRSLTAMAAPGHAPDLIVLLDRDNGILFGTDAAYADALYVQSDESDLDTYQQTLDRLAALVPDLRVVYGSHGPAAFAPSLLPEMAKALRSVRAGRPADGRRAGGREHRFDGFSIIAPADVVDADAGG